MIEERKVDTWEEFESELKALQLEWCSNDRLWPELLFRGQSSAAWPLATTLERHGRAGMSFLRYLELASFLKPDIETFSECNWDIPGHKEIAKSSKSYDDMSMKLTFGEMPASEYLAHIRHHGFPSPLLDWSRSAYVAAFFAFRGAVNDGAASIYVLSEAKAHSGSSVAPQIWRFGRSARVHKRHFYQQSEYTLCMTFAEESEWRFTEHETVLVSNDHDGEFPFNYAIRKFVIPGTERLKVLKRLDEGNLNAFTLFGSEEALMETLTLRELYFAKSAWI